MAEGGIPPASPGSSSPNERHTTESPQEYLRGACSYKEQVIKCEEQPWFHGNITRKKAEDLLATRRDGDYIVRMKPREEGFLLSHKVEGQLILHIPIVYIKHPQKDGRYLTLSEGGVYFQELDSLLEFYTLNSGGLHCILNHYVEKLTESSV